MHLPSILVVIAVVVCAGWAIQVRLPRPGPGAGTPGRRVRSRVHGDVARARLADRELDRLLSRSTSPGGRPLSRQESSRLVQVVQRFPKARFAHADLFNVASLVLSASLRDLSANDLIATIWAYGASRLLLNDDGRRLLFDAVVTALAQRHLRALSFAQVAALLWSCAAAGVEFAADEAQRLWDHVVALYNNGGTKSPAASALTQLHVWRTFAGVEPSPSGSRLAAHCRQAMASLQTRSSRLQDDVATCLKQVAAGGGGKVACEVRCPATSYSIDIVVSFDAGAQQQQLGVEVDGPYHYLRDIASGAFVPDGATLLKEDVLHREWRLVKVPWFDWPASLTGKRTHCNDLLLSASAA
ncbi:RAP domain-containing protein [Plasmodiophora brassicae]